MKRKLTASFLSLSLLAALLVGSTGVAAAQTPSARQQADTAAKPAATAGVLETTDEHGKKLIISTSNDASGVGVTINAGGLTQTFKFTSAELSTLFKAVKSGAALDETNKAVAERVRAFHAAVKNTVDRKVMERLTREIRATGEFDVSRDATAGKNTLGVRMVAASASVNSCLDWAILDFNLCMIDFEDGMLCLFSALLMYLSCDE